MKKNYFAPEMEEAAVGTMSVVATSIVVGPGSATGDQIGGTEDWNDWTN